MVSQVYVMLYKLTTKVTKANKGITDMGWKMKKRIRTKIVASVYTLQ